MSYLRIKSFNPLKFFLFGLIIGSISIISYQNYNKYRKQKYINVVESEIKEVTRFLLNDWNNNSFLKDFPPPQVIPVLRGSRIQGACGNSKYDIGNWDIGGSSYCDLTNIIYLVPEQLKSLKKEFGISTIGFVVAHEFAHALQHTYGIRLRGPSRELHADCIAGMFLKAGNKKLGITRTNVLNLTEAAYSVGSRSHGSGPQRKYALLSGMGVLPSTCSTSNMQTLSKGEINDQYMQELKQTKSAYRLIDISKTPFPKNLNKYSGNKI